METLRVRTWAARLADLAGVLAVPRCARPTSVVWLLAALAGCGEEMRRSTPPTVEVTGRVRDGARALSDGWVEFVPVDGTVGHLRSAPLGADGGFRATGLGVGTHVVRLVVRNPGAIDPTFQQYTSPIRRDVRGGEPIDVDLARERLRALERRTAAEGVR